MYLFIRKINDAKEPKTIHFITSEEQQLFLWDCDLDEHRLIIFIAYNEAFKRICLNLWKNIAIEEMYIVASVKVPNKPTTDV